MKITKKLLLVICDAAIENVQMGQGQAAPDSWEEYEKEIKELKEVKSQIKRSNLRESPVYPDYMEVYIPNK
jgi:hypothetical protein